MNLWGLLLGWAVLSVPVSMALGAVMQRAEIPRAATVRRHPSAAALRR